MSELETKQAQVKKLSARATKLKMDLHDLAEDLPINWQQIPELAQQAHDAYARLEQARNELQVLKTQAQ